MVDFGSGSIISFKTITLKDPIVHKRHFLEVTTSSKSDMENLQQRLEMMSDSTPTKSCSSCIFLILQVVQV